MDVEQHRARCVGHIGHMERAAREVPHEPAVHGTERELPLSGAFACARNVIEYPTDLGRGEVRVDRQAGLGAHHRGATAFAQGVAIIVGAAVLPDDCVVDRFAGGAVPHHGGLALIGDADRRERIASHAGARKGFGGDARLCRPDFIGVVFDPARLRVNLMEFLLRGRNDRARRIEQQRARTGGALVQRQDVGLRHAASPF